MASGKGNVACANYLKGLFNATAWANVFDNAASSPITNIYVALHTANPAAGGTQQTSEAAYTSYARVAVARTSGGWTVTSQTVTNAAAINFPAATGGSETETYASAGKSTSGATDLYVFAQLTSSLAVSNGITPSFAIGAFSYTEA